MFAHESDIRAEAAEPGTGDRAQKIIENGCRVSGGGRNRFSIGAEKNPLPDSGCRAGLHVPGAVAEDDAPGGIDPEFPDSVKDLAGLRLAAAATLR